MPIIKDGLPIDDLWTDIEIDDEVPPSGDIIVPLSMAIEHAEKLANRTGRLGLSIPNDVHVEEFAGVIAKADLIVLQLPAFTDGRAYSQARIIRKDLKFDQELRIKGDVLPDQAAYLVRCGFDSFDFDGPFEAEVWERVLDIIGSSYQRNYTNKLDYKTI